MNGNNRSDAKRRPNQQTKEDTLIQSPKYRNVNRAAWSYWRSKNSKASWHGQMTSALLVLLLISLLASYALSDDSQAVPISSFQCNGTTQFDRVCLFYDVIAFKGSIIFVSEEPVTIPDLALVWRQEPQFQYHLPIRVLSPDSVAAMGLTYTHTIQDSILWWRLDLVDNFYHMIAEHGASIHGLVCTYFGRCGYDKESLDGFRLLFIDGKPPSTWAAVNDNWSCFSNEPPIYTQAARTRVKPILLKRTMAGIGPTCRAFLFCMGDVHKGMRQRLPAQLFSSWRARMSSCLSLNPTQSVTKHPRHVIHLINRAYTSKRSMVNFDDAVVAVQDAFPDADVASFRMEGKSLKEQAQAFNKATIIVAMHGALFGNLPFMSHDAIIIELFPYMPHFDDANDHSYYKSSLVTELQAVNNITMIEYDTPSVHHTKLRTDLLAKDPLYTALPAVDKVGLWERGECPERGQWRDASFRRKYCKIKWFLKASDTVVDCKLLVEKVRDGIAVVEERRRGGRR